MSDYELCLKNLTELAQIHSSTNFTRNEATTRSQLIDKILYECLGWSVNDCIPEEAYNKEYADYTFYAPRPLLILEAKREGNYFDLPAGISSVEQSLPSLIRDNKDFAKAIEQCAGYCQKRGVQFGAVSNGHQLVAFVATRHDAPPLEGRALIFVSLDSMVENFRILWDSLSKYGIQEKNLEKKLVGHNPPVIPPKLSTKIINYPRIKSRNQLQTDLQYLSELVLEDLATHQELEEEFLKECYCKSGALSQHSLVSRNILSSRYEALFDNDLPSPTVSPAVTKRGVSEELLAQGIGRRPILLIGDVGVGKTTFLRNLMKVDASEIFKQAITLHINLGYQANLTHDLHQFVIGEMIRQLDVEHSIDIFDRAMVRGIYHSEIQWFATRSIYADKKESAPSLYEMKELEFIEEKIKDKSEHLRNSLKHIESAQKKQIVLFLDNSDQRGYDAQQKVFLMANEFASTTAATVFVTLRPETFYSSQRTGGTLSGYHPRAFTIAPPRITRVVEKRLKFGLKIARGNIPLKQLTQTTVKMRSLEAFLSVLIKSFHNNRDLRELIDNIAGGNARLALDLIRNFLGSGHVNSEKILDIYNRTGSYNVSLHEFIRAIIYGDLADYDSERSYIANLFTVFSDDSKDHFLLPLLLSELNTWDTKTGTKNGFVDTIKFYDRIQSYGYFPDQIDNAIIYSTHFNMLETTGRITPEKGQNLPPSMRITTVGAYHISKLLNHFSYVDAMIVDIAN